MSPRLGLGEAGHLRFRVFLAVLGVLLVDRLCRLIRHGTLVVVDGEPKQLRVLGSPRILLNPKTR